MKQNLNTASESEGTLAKQQEIYAEGWEAASDRVRSAAEDIYTSLLNDDFFIGALDAAEGFLKILNNIIDGSGGLVGILSTLSTLAFTIYGDKMAVSLERMVQNVGLLTGFEQKRARAFQEQAAARVREAATQKEDTQEAAKLKVLTTETELQSVINKNYESYSRQQKEIIDKEQKKLQLLGQQNIALNEQLQTSKDIIEARADDLYSENEEWNPEEGKGVETLRKFQQDLVKKIGKTNNTGNLLEINSSLDALKGYKVIEKGVSLENQYYKIQDYITNAAKEYYATLEKIKGIQSKFGNKPIDIAKISPEDRANLEAALKSLNMFTKQYKGSNAQIENGFNRMNEQLDPRIINKYNNTFIELIKSFGASEATARKYLNAIRQNAEATTKAAQDNKAYAASAEEIRKKLDVGAVGVQQWSDAVVAAGRGITSLTMAFSGLNSISNLWSNDNLSSGEKLLQTITSLSIVLPGFISLYKNLATVMEIVSKAFKVNIEQTNRDTVARAANAAAATWQTKAIQNYNEAISQSSQGTLALTGNVEGATSKFKQFISALKGAKYAAFMTTAVIGALAVGLTIYSAARKKEIEDNRKAAEEAYKAYEATKTEREENQKLISQMKEALEVYKETKENKTELDNITEQIAKRYKIEGAAIAKLTGQYSDYENVLDKIYQKQKEELSQQTQQSRSSLLAISDKVVDEARKGVGHVFQDIYTATFASSDTDTGIANYLSRNYNVLQKQNGGNIALITGASAAELARAYDELERAKRGLEQRYTADELADSDIYKNINKWLSKMSEVVKQYEEVELVLEASQISMAALDEEISDYKGYQTWAEEVNETLKEIFGEENTEKIEKAFEIIVGNTVDPDIEKFYNIAKAIDEIKASLGPASKLTEDFLREKFTDGYKPEIMALLNLNALTNESFEDAYQAAAKYKEGLDGVEEALSNIEGANKGLEVLKEYMTFDDYDKLQSAIKWGSKGIEQYSDFLAKTYEEQKVYLLRLKEIGEGNLVPNTQLTEEAAQARLTEVENQLKGLDDTDGYQNYQSELADWSRYFAASTPEARAEILKGINSDYKQEIITAGPDNYQQVIYDKQENKEAIQEGYLYNSLLAERKKLETQLEQAKISNLSKSKALIAEELKNEKLSVEAFEEQVELLEAKNKLSKESAEQQALANMKATKGAQELASNWESWTDALHSGDIIQISEVMPQIKSAVEDLLNLTPEETATLTPEFLVEKWDLVKQAINGSKEAQEQLAYETSLLKTTAPTILEEFLSGLNIENLDVSGLAGQFKEQLSKIKLDDLKVGIDLDDGSYSEFSNVCNSIIRSANLTSAQVQEAFARMGFDAKITEKLVPVTAEEYNAADPDGRATKRLRGGETGYYIRVPAVKFITDKPLGDIGGNITTNTSKSKPQNLEPAETDTRYHDIDRTIDSTTRSLDKLETQTERTFGVAKVSLFNKAIKELNKQVDNYNTRLEEANNYLKQDFAELEKLNLSVVLDTNGEISNYEDLVAAIDAAYNTEAKKFNAMSVAQQEKHKERLDQLKKEHDTQIEALEQYVKTLDERNKTQEQIDEARREVWDKSLEAATAELEITLKIKDLRQRIRDIDKKIAESAGDYLSNGHELLALEEARYKDALALKEVLESTTVELHNLANNPSADTEALNDALIEVAENAIVSAEGLLEFLEVIKTHLPNAVEAARERLGRFFETFDHNESVLGSVKELMALQGASYKTADGLAKLQKAATAQMNTQRAAMATNKQWYDSLVPRVAEAEAELAKYQVGTAGYDIAKGALDALLAEMREAETAMLDFAQRTMETARVMYETQVDALLYSLEQKLTNGAGFELLQTKYDHLISTNDRYLDEVNKIYQVEDLNRKIQADIDKSQGQYSISKLKGLQDELALMNKRNDVSAYELEIMNAKYAMLQAQIALEEAQNAKSEVRLMRDSSGNWNYQFTANQDDINTAQANYDKAVNNYYNIAKDYAKSTSADILSIQQEMMDELREIWTNEELTEQERRARMLEVQEYYFDQAKHLFLELDKAVRDTGEAGKLSIVDFENQFTLSLAKAVGDYNTFETEGKAAITEMESAFNDYQSTVGEIVKESGFDLETLEKKIGEVELATRLATKAADEEMRNSIDRISAIQEETSSWAKKAEAIRDAARAYAELGRTTSREVENNSGVKSFDKGYVEGVDYQALINTGKENGASEAEIRSWERQRDAKIADKGLEEYRNVNSGATYSAEDYEKMKKITSLSTGGFTGAWGGYGRLAFLHEKELVLNKEDTENILNAVNLVRGIGPALFQSIAETLDREAAASQVLMGSRLITPKAAAANEKLVQQVVSIDATFPGVQSASEIEIALTNLVNEAAQRAAAGPF